MVPNPVAAHPLPSSSTMVKPTEQEFHILVLGYSKPPVAETGRAWNDALPDGISGTQCDFTLYPLDKEPEFFGTVRLTGFLTGFVFFTCSDRSVSSFLVTGQTCEHSRSVDQNMCTSSRQSSQLGSKQTSSTGLQQLVHRGRLVCKTGSISASPFPVPVARGLWRQQLSRPSVPVVSG